MGFRPLVLMSLVLGTSGTIKNQLFQNLTGKDGLTFKVEEYNYGYSDGVLETIICKDSCRFWDCMDACSSNMNCIAFQMSTDQVGKAYTKSCKLLKEGYPKNRNARVDLYVPEKAPPAKQVRTVVTKNGNKPRHGGWGKRQVMIKEPSNQPSQICEGPDMSFASFSSDGGSKCCWVKTISRDTPCPTSNYRTCDGGNCFSHQENWAWRTIQYENRP